MSAKKSEWILLFQHLPKTGGVTLSHIILRHFVAEEVFHIRSRQFPLAPMFSETWGPVEEFLSLPSIERSRFRCVLGHMRFGIHEQLPLPSKYVTVFRDPVARVLSHHGQYNRMIQNRELGEGRVVSLEEYMELKPGAVDNQQTRFLTSGDFDKMSDDEKLAQARDNLNRHYLFTGVMERFDESLLIMNKMMGWHTYPYVRHNVGTSRSRAGKCPPRISELIRERNTLDAQLHSDAGRLLEEAISSYGPDFQKDLTALKRANRREERKATLISGVNFCKWLLIRVKRYFSRLP